MSDLCGPLVFTLKLKRRSNSTQAYHCLHIISNMFIASCSYI